MKPAFVRVALLFAVPFLAVIACADAPPKSGEIAAKLQPFVDHHTLAGAVTLVASKDKVLSLEAVGFQDIAAKKPMQTDCLFWIASMSKPITATALMMLVDAGKVNVDDPVEKYLPEFKGQSLAVKGDDGKVVLKKPKHPITVRNLLSHTSGLPFRSAQEQPTLDLFTLKQGAESYAQTPLIFEPDSKYQYSNAGINTAGRIIEVVSGMSYEDFLDKRLFGPLGMKDTTFRPNEEQLKRLAKSYTPNKEKTDLVEIKITQLKYPLNDRKRQPVPAGGLFSTARDIGVFCQMVLNGGVHNGNRLLSETAVKQMTSKQTGDAVKANYGFGWSTDVGTYGHGGAYSTNMTVDVPRGRVFVFMVQHSGFPNPKESGQIQPTFRKAALEKFGK
jgi:CubicO group peptidase (beta-lactamase class C family)